MTLKQYVVTGRKTPTETEPSPQIFRMRIFAPNEVVAKSRFWYFLHQYKKMKRTTGDILGVNEIRERNTQVVKNFGITLKYNSRSGTHNMYKEFRDTTLTGAVEQMYSDLAGRHRARFSAIQIIDTTVVPSGVKKIKTYRPEIHGDVAPVGVKRPNIREFLNGSIKFPLTHRIIRPALKRFRTTFTANRPTTFYS